MFFKRLEQSTFLPAINGGHFFPTSKPMLVVFGDVFQSWLCENMIFHTILIFIFLILSDEELAITLAPIFLSSYMSALYIMYYQSSGRLIFSTSLWVVFISLGIISFVVQKLLGLICFTSIGLANGIESLTMPPVSIP